MRCICFLSLKKEHYSNGLCLVNRLKTINESLLVKSQREPNRSNATLSWRIEFLLKKLRRASKAKAGALPQIPPIRKNLAGCKESIVHHIVIIEKASPATFS